MAYRPDPENLRAHPERNKALIRQSLEEVGPFRSIGIDGDGIVRAGNGVYEQAQALGLRIREIEAAPDELIAVKRPDLVGDAARRAAFFDNASGDTSYFDAALLDAAMREQPIVYGGVLTDDELAGIIGQHQAPVDIGGAGDTGEAPDLDAPTEVQPGDIWQIGRHTIACLDSTEPGNLDRALAGRTPQMVWADPPYGLDIVRPRGAEYNIPFGGKKGATSGDRARLDGARSQWGTFDGMRDRGRVVPVARYAPIVGDEGIETAVMAAGLCLSSHPDAIHVWWGANNYAHALPPSTCWIVWDKENTGDFADVELAWCNHKGAARLFRHMWNGLMKASEHGQARIHPTQKPIALCAWAFDKYGSAGDLILDPFLGSGPSLKAAERMGRAVIGFELSPHYCDHILAWGRSSGLEVRRV